MTELEGYKKQVKTDQRKQVYIITLHLYNHLALVIIFRLL